MNIDANTLLIWKINYWVFLFFWITSTCMIFVSLYFGKVYESVAFFAMSGITLKWFLETRSMLKRS